MQLKHEVILWNLTSESREVSPHKVLFFDPIAEKLLEDEPSFTEDTGSTNIDLNRVLLDYYDYPRSSAHYRLEKNGSITQLVAPEEISWNAGVDHGLISQNNS